MPARSRRIWWRWAPTALAVAASVAACGGPSSSSSSGPAAVGSPAGSVPAASATTASIVCPAASVVDAALGVTVAAPISITGGSPSATLPPGAVGVSCEYAGTDLNVIIELLGNVPPSTIDSFSARFPVPYATVPGLGDEARSFSQSLGGGKTNEGVVAVKGSDLVDITATATPATLSQLEALAGALL